VPRVFHDSLVRGSTFFKPVRFSFLVSPPTLLLISRDPSPPAQRCIARVSLICWWRPPRVNKSKQRIQSMKNRRSRSRTRARSKIQEQDGALFGARMRDKTLPLLVFGKQVRAPARGQSVRALSSINCVVKLTKGTGVK